MNNFCSKKLLLAKHRNFVWLKVSKQLLKRRSELDSFLKWERFFILQSCKLKESITKNFPVFFNETCFHSTELHCGKNYCGQRACTNCDSLICDLWIAITLLSSFTLTCKMIQFDVSLLGLACRSQARALLILRRLKHQGAPKQIQNRFICRTEAWPYQKWYQAQSWGMNSDALRYKFLEPAESTLAGGSEER